MKTMNLINQSNRQNMIAKYEQIYKSTHTIFAITQLMR
jgi:hypothetical protein